jgi:hypothetical protein
MLVVDTDGRCSCDQADKCPRGHVASMARCLKEELEEEGYKTVTLSYEELKKLREKKRYNLTFWQWFFLPLLWVIWAGREPEKRKSWHLVKKGMEKHEHKYTIHSTEHKGYMNCEHEGCVMIAPSALTMRNINNDC